MGKRSERITLQQAHRILLLDGAPQDVLTSFDDVYHFDNLSELKAFVAYRNTLSQVSELVMDCRSIQGCADALLKFQKITQEN